MSSATPQPSRPLPPASRAERTQPAGPNLAEALLLTLDSLDNARGYIREQHPREAQWAEEALQSLSADDRADLVRTVRTTVRNGRYRGDARKLAGELRRKLEALAPTPTRREPTAAHQGVWDSDGASALRTRLRGWIVDNTYSPVLDGSPSPEPPSRPRAG